jgi:hypothetical protein
MCGPATLALIGAAASVAGVVQSTNAQASQARYQADVARANQKITKWQAEDALTRGVKQENRQRLQMAALKGTQRTVLASHGLDLGEGSPLDILTGTDLIGEQDAATVRANAARDAWGYRTQGMNYQAQAGLYDTTAAQVRASQGLQIGSTLLNTAQQVESGWYRDTTAAQVRASQGLQIGSTLLNTAQQVESGWYRYNRGY